MQNIKHYGNRVAAKLCSMFLVLLFLSPVAFGSGNDADITTYNIEAQSLSGALIAFSKQSKTTLLVSDALLAGKSANALKGRMSDMEALDILLQGSGLHYKHDENNIIIIYLKKNPKKKT